MADTVNVQKLADGHRNVVYHLTNESDGTGESEVTKIDISALNAPVPTSLSLMEANWSVSSGYVVLEWDHTTNDEMLVCNGSNAISFAEVGGLPDPKASGGTGDIVLTTDGFADGDSYDLTLVFKKKFK